MKQYNKNNIPLAKELRKNMTPWERNLWYEFLRTYPIKFQRQKCIGEYIDNEEKNSHSICFAASSL